MVMGMWMSDKDDKVYGAGGFFEAGDSQHHGLIRTRTPRTENLSDAQNDHAQEMLEAPLDEVLERPLDHKPSRKWPKKSLTKGKRHKLAIMGLSEEVLAKGDHRYAEMVRLANSYRKHRARELVIAHGFVSAGVSALLSSAALALAASRYLHERFAETGDIPLLTQASKLGTDARTGELSAWELCAREAVARRKAAAAHEGVPWLQGLDGGKDKGGRPKAEQRAADRAEGKDDE
jgi:hypothetical protein